MKKSIAPLKRWEKEVPDLNHSGYKKNSAFWYLQKAFSSFRGFFWAWIKILTSCFTTQLLPITLAGVPWPSDSLFFSQLSSQAGKRRVRRGLWGATKASMDSDSAAWPKPSWLHLQPIQWQIRWRSWQQCCNDCWPLPYLASPSFCPALGRNGQSVEKGEVQGKFHFGCPVGNLPVSWLFEPQYYIVQVGVLTF